MLEWRETASADGEVEVLRVLQPGSSSISPPRSTERSSKHPGIPGRKPAQESPGEIRLRAASPASPQPAGAPEGMLDTSPVAGSTYLYSAQRVRVVSAAGTPVEYRSEPTPPIAMLQRDTFAPDAPRGLVSVPGTSPQPAKPTIDLSWEPDTDTDLEGYVVYRLDLPAGPADLPRRLTGTPLPGTAFADSDVIPGHRYRYTVTALDRAGNESPPSAPVEDATGPK